MHPTPMSSCRDAFLDTHCMSLEEGVDEAEGLLGLSFEPTEDRGVPDIRGVLWLGPGERGASVAGLSL